MNLPTDETVEDRFERLNRYARKPKPTDRDTLTTLTEMQPRLLELIRRARTPSPAVDGYPANLGGGDGRGGAELTSVESAAERLVFGKPSERDVVRDLAEQAFGYLEQAAQSVGALSGVLDRADRLSSTLSRSEAGGAGVCLCCGEDVTGGAEDRLRRGLAPACYKRWVRAGRPELSEFKRQRAS